MNCSEANGIFVKCLVKGCQEYGQKKFLKDTPLCPTHETHPTRDNSKEMFDIHGTTQRDFLERSEKLTQSFAKVIAESKSSISGSHGKIIRWNKDFEMCSKCDDVTTCK